MFDLPTPHGDKLVALLNNKKLTAKGRQKNRESFVKYLDDHPFVPSVVHGRYPYLLSGYHKSITRKNLYWDKKQKELIENAKAKPELTSSQSSKKEVKQQIDNQNPFTWILTVNCSEKTLNLFGAQPANEFGAGVYRITPTFRMGIVIITQLDDSSETMWLKMLGDKQTAQSAFELIKQLSPQLREKNDIIGACIKYCVYLRDIPSDNLTPEDKDFMKTMEQIDAWYEAEMNKAELKGKIESASTMIRVKFGA